MCGKKRAASTWHADRLPSVRGGMPKQALVVAPVHHPGVADDHTHKGGNRYKHHAHSLALRRPKVEGRVPAPTSFATSATCPRWRLEVRHSGGPSPRLQKRQLGARCRCEMPSRVRSGSRSPLWTLWRMGRSRHRVQIVGRLTISGLFTFEHVESVNCAARRLPSRGRIAMPTVRNAGRRHTCENRLPLVEGCEAG